MAHISLGFFLLVQSNHKYFIEKISFIIMDYILKIWGPSSCRVSFSLGGCVWPHSGVSWLKFTLQTGNVYTVINLILSMVLPYVCVMGTKAMLQYYYFLIKIYKSPPWLCSKYIYLITFTADLLQCSMTSGVLGSRVTKVIVVYCLDKGWFPYHDIWGPCKKYIYLLRKYSSYCILAPPQWVFEMHFYSNTVYSMMPKPYNWHFQ